MSWFQQHKKATWLSLSGLAAVLLAGGIVYYVHSRENEHKGSGQQDKRAGPVPVRIIHPKEGGVERLVRRPGTVQSFEYAELFAKVSGYLENQKVDIGYQVKKGDALAEVYAPELFKNVEKADADLKKARANAKAAEARVHKAQADLAEAQSRYEETKADLERSQAMLELRKKQYVRYKNLAERNAIQQELVDEKLEAQYAAESTLNASQKAVITAKSGIAAAKAGVEQAEADLVDAEAAISVAKAVLDRAKVLAKYTQIISPYTGVVTVRNFHNGDFIRDASQGTEKPLLAVARTDKMRVIIYVPDTAVPFLKVGDEAQLDIDALPDDHLHGKIARLAYAESLESRTMRAEVDMDNPDGLLKAGMYGRLTIALGREKGMRVPSTCLFGSEKEEDRSVYVVRDGKAHEVKVRVGIDDGIEATVRGGLDASDRVVVERVPGLAESSPVEVVGEGLEKAKISLKKGEDNETAGKEGTQGKQSSGKKSSPKGQSDGAESATSNFSGRKESDQSGSHVNQERKEFEDRGDKEGARRKRDSDNPKK